MFFLRKHQPKIIMNKHVLSYCAIPKIPKVSIMYPNKLLEIYTGEMLKQLNIDLKTLKISINESKISIDKMLIDLNIDFETIENDILGLKISTNKMSKQLKTISRNSQTISRNSQTIRRDY